MADQFITPSFSEVLVPLLRRLNAKRSISMGKAGVLRYLAEHDHATMTELAAAVGVTQQAISLAARELEHSQFIVRVADPADRRRVWIGLTDRGGQKLAQESSASQAWLDREIKERLTPGERKTLDAAIPVLRKLGSDASGA